MKYMGQDIYECERIKGEHAGRWTIQTYHHTGNPYADELCPHYRTLAEAKAAIREAHEAEEWDRKLDRELEERRKAEASFTVADLNFSHGIAVLLAEETGEPALWVKLDGLDYTLNDGNTEVPLGAKENLTEVIDEWAEAVDWPIDQGSGHAMSLA